MFSSKITTKFDQSIHVLHIITATNNCCFPLQ